jgi:ribonuclease HI
MKKVICYTAGGAQGNPGPAAIGVYITDAAGIVLKEVGRTIGNGTNNYAEYHAVMVALETVRQIFDEDTKTTDVEIRLDSELVKKQLNGESQINEPGLVPLFIAIHNLRVASFPNIVFTQIPQEQNTEADRLVNEALDGKR